MPTGYNDYSGATHDPLGFDARVEMFNYIEFFYKPKSHHGNNDGLPPMKHEKSILRI